MNVRSYGEHDLLCETDDPLGFAAAACELPGVREVVPAARTVLVVPGARTDPARLRELLTELEPRPVSVTGDALTLDVRYDGPDLDATAAELGLDPDGLVRAHASGDYIVAFCGFVPGFAYLTGLDPPLHLPRLPDPRSRVPAGSVGIAGEFTGVYPRASPGGWRLLGTTDAALWDLDRDPPAVLPPGTRVRFRPVP